MARLIRIAVKLLLIVSVTTQSTMLCAWRELCSLPCASSLACMEGDARNATDAQAGECCGCCKARQVQPAERGSGCCGVAEREHSTATAAVEGAMLAQRLTNSGEPEDTDACCDDGETTLSPGNTCHCLWAPQTPCAPAPKLPANEDRDHFQLNFTSIETVDFMQRLASPWTQASVTRWILPHFSQIQLCVWRL